MAHFEGHLDLQLAEGPDGRPLTRDGRSTWSVNQPLTYDDGLQRITVPDGFITDLASIPRLVWNLLPPDGPWAKAAVVHDFLYATHGTGVTSDGGRWITKPGGYSRAEADQVLYDAMACLGVPRPTRLVIWAAVRVGGGRGWGS